MDACFNRIYWKISESILRKILMDQLIEDGYDAEVYLVTGTVPNPNSRIPQRENPAESWRVTVPSHIWTAVCYKHNSKDINSFSFAYIGRNQPETSIIPMSVPNLNRELSQHMGQGSISIFVDDCFTGNPKSQQAVAKFRNKLPENQRLKMPANVLNIFNAVKRVSDRDNDSPPVKVTGMRTTLSIDSLQSYSSLVEDLKSMESACLITTAEKSFFPEEKSELRKRDVFEQSEPVECIVVPEKSVVGSQTAADGTLCQRVSDSIYGCNCITESETKSCCSTPCLYRQERKSYWCYSGQTQIQCSPQYSLITYKGEKCKDNHPCATYGYDYYWCYKSSGSWDYCSPPLFQSKAEDGNFCRNNHACDKYGKSDPYCYTDDDNNKKSCCISDDCFSAVNGKTCKSDHPCGYYDYSNYYTITVANCVHTDRFIMFV